MYDLLVKNCRAYTLEREGEVYRAFAVRKGRIAALFEEIPPSALKNTKKVLDLGGKTVIPGLIDSHAHFMATCALRDMALKISEVKDGVLSPATLEEAGAKIRAFAADKDPQRPVACYSYIIASIAEDRLPNRAELDAWLPGRVVIVLAMDGHSSSYSTAALQKMGLDTPEHDGILEGKAHEFNVGKINQLVADSLTLPILARSMQLVANDALAWGLTGIHCLEGYEDAKDDKSLKIFLRFAGVLPLRLRLYIQYRDLGKADRYLKRLKSPRIGGCGSWEVDGSIGSRTAAFDEPYQGDPGNSGQVYYDAETLADMIREGERRGCQTAAHAIGTRGIGTLLEAFRRAGTKKGLRPRIEHFEFPTRQQAAEAVDRLGAVISVQPGYAYMDQRYQKSYEKYLSSGQRARMIPLRSLAEMGGILCGSSDSPVQDMNPFLQIQGMVLYPMKEERLTVYQALRTYTFNGAYATFEEKERGTLSVGKLADFAVLDRDPFLADPETLLETRALRTFLAGKPARPMKLGTAAFLLKSLLAHKKL